MTDELKRRLNEIDVRLRCHEESGYYGVESTYRDMRYLRDLSMRLLEERQALAEENEQLKKVLFVRIADFLPSAPPRGSPTSVVRGGGVFIERSRSMKKLIEEVSGEGLEGLMGERVTFFGMNYIYTGKLVGINDEFVKLDDAAIVYETGALDSPSWKDAQSLPNPAYIMLRCVESFMVLK